MVNNRLLPTGIGDRNGNWISIAYKPDCFQVNAQTYCGMFAPNAIDYVTDTLGRHIEFEYDLTYQLTKITAPGFGGTAQNPATRTLVQFDYQDRTVSYNFSGLTVDQGDNVVWNSFKAPRHVYFPATGTGYMFYYSDYGMVYAYSVRRQMSLGGWPPVTIQDGVKTASILLNYPTSGTTLLTDAPSFDQRNEWAVNSPLAIYTYTRQPENTAEHSKMFRIQRPDTTILELTRSTDSAAAANGLLIRSELKNGPASLGKTELTYTTEGSGFSQVKSVTSFDDSATPLQTKVDFDYDQYDNVTNKREYGLKVNGQWQVKRRTHYSYASFYYLYGRLSAVEAYDATGASEQMVAKTEYVYDNYASMGGVENYGGTASPPGRAGNPVLAANVTGVTQYVDFAQPTPSVIQRRAKYDIFGNVVRAEVSCCQIKDLTNTEATYWSQPIQIMSGDANGVHQTSSTDFDFNTSLRESYTGPGGQTISYDYDAALRPYRANLTTGATAQSAMNYGTLSSSSIATYDDGGVTKSLTSTAQYDGWGRIIQAVDTNNSQVNTSYDTMGSVQSRTNPFQAGQQPGAITSFEYDLLGRLKKTTLPDGNTVQNLYEGSSITAIDHVGRKIKRESDGLGRLVKVTEQDSAGALTQGPC